MTNKKAFTLLELMVAMGIMAVLVTMSVLGVRTVQRSLRNTQREDVMKTVQLEIQGYFNDNGFYPTLSTSGTDGIKFTPTAVILDGNTIIELDGAKRGEANITSSSSNGTAYCYSSSQASYGLAVNLENKGWTQFGNSPTDCETNVVTSGN